MQRTTLECSYPDFWTPEFFGRDDVQFEQRPLDIPLKTEGIDEWYKEYQRVLERGVDAGIRWDFLYDSLYWTQGYEGEPKVSGWHINRR